LGKKTKRLKKHTKRLKKYREELTQMMINVNNVNKELDSKEMLQNKEEKENE
jgi:hypothetical protein